MSQRALLACAAAVLAPSLAAAEMRSLSLAARVNRDVGTVFVSGTESGPGGGIGVRLSFGDDDVRWEPEAGLDLAGYSGQGDGDPIVMGTVMVSRRAFFSSDDTGARPWWSIGAGAGMVAIAGAAAGFPVRVALGVSLAPRSPVGLEASVFNRFTLTSKSGDPSTEYINSTGVELAVRFGH
jgi:hypothetical protein